MKTMATVAREAAVAIGDYGAIVRRAFTTKTAAARWRRLDHAAGMVAMSMTKR